MGRVAQLEAPRVLYLPNEEDAEESHRQTGPRRSFLEMERDGTIRELGMYSFLADFRTDLKRGRSQRRLLDEVEAFQPDIVFWQHPQEFPIDAELLHAVRRRGGNPFIAYHEGDPFNVFYKRTYESERALYRECDIFLTVALGPQMRLFQRWRFHPHFHYLPSFFTQERAVAPPDPSVIGSRYDAVMIGSIAYRLKLLKQPGSPGRIRLAQGLRRVMGDRFAVYGRNWPSGINARGYLDPLQQTPVIQSSRMSVIWENFPEHTFYFSDRLPISIASGVPHITSRRQGYETLFAQTPGLFFADSVDDAIDIACYLRSLPLERIVELGLAARAWAFANLEADVVCRHAMSLCMQVWRCAP